MTVDDLDSEAHLRALVEATSDALITIDPDGQIQFVDPSIEAILGYSSDDLCGESLSVLMAGDVAERHLESFDQYLETEQRQTNWDHIELPGLHRDGHEVPLQISFSEFALDGERFFAGVLRDISELNTLQAEQEILHEARDQILEAETFADGLRNGLQIIVESMDWIYGEAWLPSYSADRISWETAWFEGDASPEAFRESSAKLEFEPGEGLVGRVWESGEYEWVPDVSAVDDSVFERSATARATGLKAALAVPILSDGAVQAVMVFLMPSERSYDDRIVEVTRTVAANLGLLVARQQAHDSLRQERNLISGILEATPVGILVIDRTGEFTYANDEAESILRIEENDGSYPPYESLSIQVLDADGEPLDESEYPYQQVLQTGEDVTREVQIEYPSGERRWLFVHGTPFGSDGEVSSTVFALQDISEQKRRTEQLTRLNQLGQDLSDVESFQEGCEVAVAAARDILGLSVTTIELYDPEAGQLETCARTDCVVELVGDDPLFSTECDLAWETFIQNEPHVYSDLPVETDLDPAVTPLSTAIILPIGGHGVLISGATEPDSFEESVVTLAQVLVRNVESAFDRLDREVSLRDQKAELESKNRQLQRVQRVNGDIRDITRSLMEAESTAEIKQLVCDRLAESDPYRFVWFGERDLSTSHIRPAAWAGVENGYLDAVTVTADTSATGQGPAGRALRTREPQIQNNLQSDPPFEPWRQEAMKRDYRASIAVPVVYNDTVYGLLNLYANEPEVFSDMEKTVLAELGEMIGFALNSRERYNALVSEESVELEFEIRDSEHPLLRFLSERDGKFTLENLVTRTGGEAEAFATFENVPYSAIQELVERQGVEGPTLIRERDNETIVEIPLPSGTFVQSLLDRGAVPTQIKGAPREGRMTIRISKTASPREFVELFQDQFEEAELVARREIDDPVGTTQEFEQGYLDQLTERQEEVLKTAFFAGFFEQPRANSASDIADMLGVSQPTVSRHIRSGQESLFSMLFGDGGS